MSIENFIPEIWSARLLDANEKALVYGNVVNRDYEGEISGAGDTVRINEIGDPTISTYTKNSTITLEELTDAQKELKVDQQKYFAFFVDDVDKAQQKPKVMDEAMKRAGIGLGDDSDQYIAALHGDAGVKTGLGTTATPIEINSANIVEYFGKVNEGLDENHVPRADRWAVIPTWMITKLALAKIINVTDNLATFENGFVAKVMGFSLWVSTNVVNTASAKYKILAGDRRAISFVNNIQSVEAYRPENRFADAMKGLYVYGAKVVRPKNLAVLTANQAAEA